VLALNLRVQLGFAPPAAPLAASACDEPGGLRVWALAVSDTVGLRTALVPVDCPPARNCLRPQKGQSSRQE